MRGALRRAAPPLVVDLRGGDVAVAEQILNFPDVHTGIQEQGCRRRPEGVRRINVYPRAAAVSLTAPGTWCK